MSTKKNPSEKRIIIFASGEGSNAKNIINYFSGSDNVKIVHVLSNNIRAKVLKTAHDLEVNALHFDKTALYHSNEVLNILKDTEPHLIVLAGFLWMLPKKILHAFPDKIINIHPALLPKYGGKGMFGKHVHEAVLNDKATETGITIHYVNEEYDKGEVIAQYKVKVEANDNLASLSEKIRKLEHTYFPRVIEKLLFNKK